MRVLVTGGAGYIGSVVAAQLVAAGHEVTVLDDLSTGHADAVPAGAAFIKGTLRDCAAEVLADGIEAVLHFAAKSLVGESVAEPAKYWSANLGGTIALLEAMREIGVRTIVFSSTAAVYGEPERTPITETDPARPTSPYGASKLAADTTLTEFARLYGFGAVSLRYFNVAGAHRSGDGCWLGERHNPETHLIPNVLARVAAGGRVQVFGDDYPTPDGTCIRDYIHVTDLADAHLRALAVLPAGPAPRVQPRQRDRLLGPPGDRRVRRGHRHRDRRRRDRAPARRPGRAGRLVGKDPGRARLAGRAGPAGHGRRRLGVHPLTRAAVTGPAAVLELFRSRFGGTADGVWFAPGRANLMGEHTDYNEGFVLPFALGQGIVAAAARRSDRRLVLCSAQEPGSAGRGGPGWPGARPGHRLGRLPGRSGLGPGLRRLRGAGGLRRDRLRRARRRGPVLVGRARMRHRARADRPGRAGRLPVDPRRELAAIARRAENDFVGVPSGIMDQSASLLGRRGHALLLDCRSLEASQVPFDPAASGARLLLINTRASHELTAGEYGRRRAECEQAARLLGVPSLRYLTDVGDLHRLTDPVLRRRARHVVTDNQRVLEVAGLLTSGSGDPYPAIGRLLTQAHLSLRDDFEVSWPEADATVDAALAAGALGARMIGGGFGGSVLALVREAEPVRAAVAGAFARRSWTAPEFLEAAPSDSARRLGLFSESSRGRKQCGYVMRRQGSPARSPSCGTRSTGSPRSAWTCRRPRPRCSTRWTGCRWRSAPARG